ncbi:unnamed protein product [Adineta steineri]|uniref:G-protein coupled receptors family 1 profile domain-containing protein n=1 Tax=Adineta steineri TaxID=433720 RepID=A0A813W8C1_9BILA|nr:unnamed protein product [Adineta steineri]CAF0853856.1 unnamed protein product [Adineta steineri]CAF1287361.1 unnamed protein product [Adineta steineri]CAF1509169.1 unnamed protein product [Adineta steineri]CAF3577651.1 unnamed protein product [Adineta steineri]
MSCIICSIYWIIYSFFEIELLNNVSNWNCSIFEYFQTIVNCQEIYSVCNISIHRFCIILYNNKLLFKSRQWVFTCIGIQWLLGMICPLPLFTIFGQSCENINEPLWLRLYILLIVLVIPSILFLLINIFIVLHARSSRQRVAPIATINQEKLTYRRDIRLIKRMLILLLIFLFGWSPVYIVFAIQNTYSLSVQILKLLATVGVLAEIINLFLYNRKVLIFLKNNCLHCRNM